MILDFNAMTPVAMEHFKGGEGTVTVRKFDDPRMGGVVHLTLPAGTSIGLHTHVGNCEVVYVLSGNGSSLYDDGEYEVHAGDVLYCPESHSHAIRANRGEDVLLLGVLPMVK